MISDNYNFQLIEAAHPAISVKIKLYWGHPEFTPYVDSLLHYTRTDVRQGFSMAVTSALMHLQDRHDGDFPTLVRKSSSGWDFDSR